MKIFFRVDASLQIGAGHVYRCLSIANTLLDEHTSINFICRNYEGNLIDVIKSNGFDVFSLELRENYRVDDKLLYSQWLGATQKIDAEECIDIVKQEEVDWMIVDHYGIDEEWESKLKNFCKKIFVIDDLSDRAHKCDVLLDPTFGRQENEYKHLVKKSCKLLLGSQYAILRTEFIKLRKYCIKNRDNFKFNQLLVSMGGIDFDNFTEKVVQVLDKCTLPSDIVIVVVVGENYPHLRSLRSKLNNLAYRSEIRIGVNNMAEIIANSDIAIGATGGSTWERCCLGLPTIQILTADNQKYIANSLSSIKAIELVDYIYQIPLKINKILKFNKKMSIISSSIVDGLGTQRIVDFIKSNHKYIEPIQLKPIESHDSDFIYGLQNKETRKYFFNPNVPSNDEHTYWFLDILNSDKSILFMIKFKDCDAGILRLDNIDSDFTEISIIILRKYRGKGIAKKALKMLENLVSNRAFKAVIRKDNESSKKIFTQSGYILKRKKGSFFEYLKLI